MIQVLTVNGALAMEILFTQYFHRFAARPIRRCSQTHDRKLMAKPFAVALIALSSCNNNTGVVPQTALAKAAQECSQGNQMACRMVAAIGATPPETSLSVPSTYDPNSPSTGPTLATNWWRSIVAPENEVFVGVTTGDMSAIWANSRYVTTSAGTKVVFVHVEYRDRTAPDYGLSRAMTLEFDCARKKFRVLETSGHNERNNNGSLLFAVDSPGNWSFVPPGSIGDSIANQICISDLDAQPGLKKKLPSPNNGAI